jgi:prepilin-type N-terminal cleavage/methylation domain-containing protein
MRYKLAVKPGDAAARWRAFTLIEMLITLAIAAAMAAIALRQRSEIGNFHRAESILRSYLSGVADHVKLRGCENFFLIIGGANGDVADELLLASGSESPIPVVGFHLNLRGLGAIVLPGDADGSNFPMAEAFDSLRGTWISLAAKEIFSDDFHIVLRSTGRRPVFQRFQISANGNVISEPLRRIHPN